MSDYFKRLCISASTGFMNDSGKSWSQPGLWLFCIHEKSGHLFEGPGLCPKIPSFLHNGALLPGLQKYYFTKEKRTGFVAYFCTII